MFHRAFWFFYLCVPRRLCGELKCTSIKGRDAEDAEVTERLVRCAEEGGEAEEIREDTGCRDLGSGARSSDDHRLSVVARSLETDDIVAALQAGERMVYRVAAHLS